MMGSDQVTSGKVVSDWVIIAVMTTLVCLLSPRPDRYDIRQVQGLIIAVMYEKVRGKESRWAPYLGLIPDDMTHMPLYWKVQYGWA